MMLSNLPIQSVSFSYETNNLDLKPIFGGSVQRVARGGDRWSVQIETASLLQSDAMALTSQLNLGLSQKVQFKIPTGDIVTTGFTASGKPSPKVVQGAGRSLKLGDLTAGRTLKAGQFITVKYNKSGNIISHLQQITADSTVYANGVADVSILPSVRRTGNLANSPVEIEQPYIEGFTSGESQTVTTSTYKLSTYKFSFTISEAE